MTRPIPQAAVELVKRFEGCSLRPYHDSAGYPTIGYGHLLSDQKWAALDQWDSITYAEAEGLLVGDMAAAAAAVERLVKVQLSDNQFAALISFAFNCGADEDADTLAEGLGDSTLLKKLNAGDYQGAAAEFSKWVRAGGKIVPGLVRRRAAEYALFAS